MTPGETLTLVVGGGGNSGGGSPSTAIAYGGFGGGGNGYGGNGNNTGNLRGGGGGGRSAILRGSTELITAGAGGGGNGTSQNYGGAGGGDSGAAGGAGTAGSPGGGGTQAAGGAGGNGSHYQDGSQDEGGFAIESGGGGGGGWYGGGAGGGWTGQLPAGLAVQAHYAPRSQALGSPVYGGGGGGSGYVLNPGVTGGSTSPGSNGTSAGADPANTADPNYQAGIGLGGGAGAAGGNGLIVLIYYQQTIAFGALPDRALSASPFTVSATALSGLPVSFNSQTTSVCTVSGSQVTLAAVGLCTLQATQAGNSTFPPAPPVSQSFHVTKASPTITWPQPAPFTFGGALGSGQLNASANVPGTFVYTPPAGTVLLVGNGQTLSVTFTPADSVDYATVTASTTINVISKPPSGVNLVVTNVLQRIGGYVVVRLTIADTGLTAANNVTLTSVKVGSVSGTPPSQSLGTIGSGAIAQATVQVPGSVGASGTASSITGTGTYTGGTFSFSMRITFP